MKAVIIGGGIAGLTLAILLRDRRWDVVVSERSEGMPNRGHAFLMHSDGLSILKDIFQANSIKLRSEKVDTFSLRRPDDTEIKRTHLDHWHCIKRVDLIQYLYAQLPHELVKEGREFSHFIYENNRAIAAVFFNGDVEYGDIFIGADGGNSRVRDLIHGKVHFTDVKVKEIVGVANKRKIVKSPEHTFVKYQDKDRGLAAGMIPTSGTEFVWFMQFDTSVADISDTTPEALRTFCYSLLGNFPGAITSLLECNDFSTSYVWNTRDFDVLPSFHKDNIVLIGDAAHLALPFTSAGTTNALIDAKTVADCLGSATSYEQAFEQYYNLRAEDVAGHIKYGREMKEKFLNPESLDEDNIPVPLISGKGHNSQEYKTKLVKVQYFTDPICSTCWIIQPMLRKLKLEYDEYVDVDYRMGGLLPSWEGYNKGIIKQPADAAKHWEEVSVIHQMPIDGDIWYEDPLASSYPPSIAFKAAQIQDKTKAELFLRRIKEMVFLEKKNIIKWRFLEAAALSSGLDSAKLLRDMKGKGLALFNEDIALAQQLRVTVFPTLLFTNCSEKKFTLKGFQPYEKYEEIITQLIPNAKKVNINTDPEFLFTEFPTMTNKEFAFLGNHSMDEADRILANLYHDGNIDKYESKNGVIWISKYAAVEERA